jgi:hypothetical protein
MAAIVCIAAVAYAQTSTQPGPNSGAAPGSGSAPAGSASGPPSAGSAVGSGSGSGSEPTVSDEDLSDIEAAIGADQKAQASSAVASTTPTQGTNQAAGALRALLNPDISVILDVAAAAFSDQSAQLQTGGHDPTHNGFNLQQLELSFIKNVDPYFRFDSHLVFGPDGFELEEAYATTLDLPAGLQVRAGQFLTQFGRINSTHPHTWDFVDQPFAIGRVFGGDGNRGLGVELSYLMPLPFYVMLIGSLTDPHGEGTARSFLGEDEREIDSPLDLQKTLAAKEFFELSDDWSLLTGVSFASAANAFGLNTRTDVYGADAFLKWRPVTYQSNQQVTVQTEWLLRRMQVGDARRQDLSGYAYAQWRFAKRWATGARWELGTADSGPIPDPLDPAWTGNRTRYTADLTFWPTEFSRLRVQGSLDDATWQDPVWAAFFAFEVVVGAHGAHVF